MISGFIVVGIVLVVMCIIGIIISSRSYSILKTNKSRFILGKILVYIPWFGFVYKDTKSMFNLIYGKETDKDTLLTNIIISVYLLIVVIGLLFVGKSNILWYVKFLEIVILFSVPYLGIKAFIVHKKSIVLNEIPDAIEQLAHWTGRGLGLKQAIEMSVPHMKPNVGRIFKNFAYNLNSDSYLALKLFKDAFRDPYINSLHDIFKLSIDFGSDITSPLTDLGLYIASILQYKKQVSNSMLKYKIVDACLALTIPMMVYANIFINPKTKSYFQGSNQGVTLVAIGVLACMAYYAFLKFLEKE